MFAVLEASKEWGVAPWTWAGGDPLTWYYRWIAWKNRNQKKHFGDHKQSDGDVANMLNELGI